jgi:hypothetical protein
MTARDLILMRPLAPPSDERERLDTLTSSFKIYSLLVLKCVHGAFTQLQLLKKAAVRPHPPPEDTRPIPCESTVLAYHEHPAPSRRATVPGWKVSSCGGSRYEQMINGHVKRAAAIEAGGGRGVGVRLE